jgi:hypothetical protein
MQVATCSLHAANDSGMHGHVSLAFLCWGTAHLRCAFCISAALHSQTRIDLRVQSCPWFVDACVVGWRRLSRVRQVGLVHQVRDLVIRKALESDRGARR